MVVNASRHVKTLGVKNVLLIFGLLVAYASGIEAGDVRPISGDAREIMKQSLDAGEANALRLKSYISRSRVTEKETDPSGAVRSETVKAYETLVIEGVTIRKLVSKNGKPLSGDDARKEEELIGQRVRNLRTESVPAKAKRLEDRKKKHDKEHDFNQEILNAFDLKIIGEEVIEGRKNWILDATPRPGYEPKEMRAKIFPHLRGRIWVDEQDKLWTKADAVGIDSFSLGFGMIAKLEQGAHLYFEQARMKDGTWVLKESGLKAVAHFALVKRIGIDQVSVFLDYRKVPPGTDVDDSTER